MDNKAVLFYLAKYFSEALAIGIVIKALSGKIRVAEVVAITLAIMLSFIIIDIGAPKISESLKQGTGFGIGLNLVNAHQVPIFEGMDDPVALDYYVNDRTTTLQPQNLPKDKFGVYPSSDHIDGSPFTAGEMPDHDPTAPIPVVQSMTGGSRGVRSRGGNRGGRGVGVTGGGYGDSVGGDDSILFHSVPALLPPDLEADSSCHENFTNAGVGVGLGMGMGETATGATLNSGDLINISGTENGMIGEMSLLNKFIRMRKTPLGNKLFKLRVQLETGHSDFKRVPIKYGDNVRLIFTSNAEDKYLTPVNLSSSSPMSELTFSSSPSQFSTFQIRNVGSNSGANVKYGDSVMLFHVATNSYVKWDTAKCRLVGVGVGTGTGTGTGAGTGTSFQFKTQNGCGPLWRF